MTISVIRNHFLEALKFEFDIKDIEIDYISLRVIPVENVSPYGKNKVAYPPTVRWTFDNVTWWCYAPKPMFNHRVATYGFFEHHETTIDYDDQELIRVIELSKTCKNADELNTILHGSSKPPKPFLNERGHMESYK